MATELSALGVDYDISDTHASAERIAAYDLVVCCTYDFMDSAEAAKLVSSARAGSRVLVGPVVPSLDREMFPSELLAREIGRPGSRIEVYERRQGRRSQPPSRTAAGTGRRRGGSSSSRRATGGARSSSPPTSRKRRSDSASRGLNGARLAVLWGEANGASGDSEQRMPGHSVFAWEVRRP